MLRSLSIRNILLIEHLDLDFQPGLNVLTGETGAGKSILLDSLGFVLGWRGQADLVRQGANTGEVTALFELGLNHPAQALLKDAGLPVSGELILRRVNGRDGRKTAYVNDRRCSGEILRRLSDLLVELHGQHDDRGLLNPRGHRALLDSYAKADLEPVKTAWQSLSFAQKDLAKARATLEAASKDADFLRHSVSELKQFSPITGEDAELDTKRRLMQAAERIREDIAKAAMALGTTAAEGAMGDAYRWLEGISEKAEGRLDEPLAALERALSELADAQRGVEDCLEALEFNPYELEQTEERLFALRDLARKHMVPPDELCDLAQDLSARLQAIDTGDEKIAELAKAVDQANLTYQQEAQKLHALRMKSAKKLDAAMAKELTPLKLERAAFETRISAGSSGAEGFDEVAFTVATNPGAPAGPIDKIASGGELSRFLLALKVCLTSRSDGLTMIFDEIDRGVGGATADAVGRRLAVLSEGAQILVVTHSPQVAALGNHHWQVSKSVAGDQTTTDVCKKEAEARVDEIARMLAGDVITDAARAAARALLDR